MLVQFQLKNILSFKEETILDMTAIPAYKEHKSNMIDIDRKEKFLRVSAIYGANASGKSNLCKAIKCFQTIVSDSINNVEQNGKTAINKLYMPFSFETTKENTEFQVVFIDNNLEYRYGFEYNADMIIEEWFYIKSLETNRISTILERAGEEIKFGATIRKECDLYKGQIPKETLVLSLFNRLVLNTDIFRKLYNQIQNIFVVAPTLCEDLEFFESLLEKVIDGEKDNFLEFLKAIDSGIQNIECHEHENQLKFTTYHVGKDGKSYPLDLFSESEGTRKSIMLYILIRYAIFQNRVMVVDELNIKLHPLLLKFIIDLFYDENSKAQLIYTTHDTTLLDKKFFRRDQIWFVQKDEYGYSELVALSEFKVRSDSSFEKDYLSGVYGGIPFLKDFDLGKEG